MRLVQDKPGSQFPLGLLQDKSGSQVLFGTNQDPDFSHASLRTSQDPDYPELFFRTNFWKKNRDPGFSLSNRPTYSALQKQAPESGVVRPV